MKIPSFIEQYFILENLKECLKDVFVTPHFFLRQQELKPTLVWQEVKTTKNNILITFYLMDETHSLQICFSYLNNRLLKIDSRYIDLNNLLSESILLNYVNSKCCTEKIVTLTNKEREVRNYYLGGNLCCSLVKEDGLLLEKSYYDNKQKISWDYYEGKSPALKLTKRAFERNYKNKRKEVIT